MLQSEIGYERLRTAVDNGSGRFAEKYAQVHVTMFGYHSRCFCTFCAACRRAR
jgi:hypothetical protein